VTTKTPAKITLDYRDNVLSFEFVSLHFAEPKKNHFACQLEDFDQKWVYPDAEKRFVHYTNLPYREFTFRVKSANGDGLWGGAGVGESAGAGAASFLADLVGVFRLCFAVCRAVVCCLARGVPTG